MRVICPACGCNLEPVPGAVPGPVGCPGCGKRIDLRKHLGASPPQLPAPAVDAAQAAPASPPAVARRGRSWPLAVGFSLAGALGGTAAVALLASRSTSPPAPVPVSRPRDSSRRSDLRSIEADARAEESAGHLRRAYDAYNSVQVLAREYGESDPGSEPIVAEADAAQDRVFAAMTKPPAANAMPEPVWIPAPKPVPATAPVRSASVPVEAPLAQLPPASRPATAPAPLDPAAAARLAADTAPPLAHAPPPPRLTAYAMPEAVTDAEIGQAIDRAIVWLRANGPGDRPSNRLAPGRRTPTPDPTPDTPPGGDDGSALGDLPPVLRPLVAGGGGRAGGGGGDYTAHGYNLLATYALLQAGQATDRPGLRATDPAVVAALNQIKTYPLDGTYVRSLRATTLAVYNRVEDRSALEDDVRWLITASRRGGYTYTNAWPRGESFDNSNSQYGLLGVWSGAQAGIGVSDDYWRAVERHWMGCASPAGTWGYTRGDTPYLSMTLAGVASLLVTHEYLDAAAEASGLGRPPTRTLALDAGLNWLDQGDNCTAGIPESSYPAYTLYGLERVGLASGYKYFGNHDWYAELARRLVDQQRGDGSWDDSVLNTSYCLLFLARGRHPILFNKLRYPGGWDDRPHDVAHLARFAAQQLERPLNWQVVNLRRKWSDWMDSPVLYISGDSAPQMTVTDVHALRDFALAGGLIFTHADGGSPAFTAWVRQFVRQAFPKYELMRVPKADPLNTVLYHLKEPPVLESVTNGSRLLLVHSPTDIADGWQLNWTDDRKPAFEFGLNLFVYAAGKTNYKNRLASTYIPAVPDVPDVTRAVARLRFAGGWDPEPYAWTRFARYFQWETRAGLDVQTVDLKSLTPGEVPVAFLTGTVRQDFTPAEAAAARAYVQAGGVLVIDACGGQTAFANSVRTTLLAAAFPGISVNAVPSDHPVFLPSRPFADDLRKMPLRPFASEQLGSAPVPIEGLQFGRGWVLFSRLDLTTGLLGTQSWGILGYDPAYAQALVKNAVLWAVARSVSAGR